MNTLSRDKLPVTLTADVNSSLPVPSNSHVHHQLQQQQPYVQPLPASAGSARPPPPADTGNGSATVTFPLSELFDAHVACRVCFTDGKALSVSAAHSCSQDLLVVQSTQTGQWFRVRQRINHLDFAGRYHMCNQQPNYAIGKRCPRGDSCTFAHSEVERALWMAEKQGQFNIQEFISQRGSRSKVTNLYTIQSMLNQYPGQLAFLCRRCYLESRRVSMQNPSDSAKCSVEAHDWSTSAILAHCSLAGATAGNITLISPCLSPLTSCEQPLCLMGVFCGRRWTGDCRHAHTVIERELWCVQRDCALTQRQIVQQVCARTAAPYGFRGCKNRPAPFPGRIS